MTKTALQVPDRFLAFAFGAGDVLLELDASLNIVSIDGAVALIDPSNTGGIKTLNFASLLNDADHGELASLKALNKRPSFRYGPVTLAIGRNPKKRQRFCMFVNKVLEETRLFMTLSLESRIVRDVLGNDDEVLSQASSEAFFSKVETLLETLPNDASGLKMSVVDALSKDLPKSAAAAVVRGLSQQSIDGGAATQITPGRFAVLHSSAKDAPSTEDIVTSVEANTGISLKGIGLDHTGAGQVQPAIFLHTLKEIVSAGGSTSLEGISDSYNELLQGNVERANQFRKVLSKNLFTLAYQPIVSLKDRKIHHYEALTRFKKNSGFDTPFEAIKFAEDTGLIAEFDMQVLSRVCKEIILAKGRKAPVKLAVNVSGNSLSDATFCENLIKLLKKNLANKDDLHLEITESFQITNLEALADVVRDIQQLGFKVCLDDFGAGASGFQYLRILPVDCVKIDGPYIRDALDDPSAKAFLGAMIGLCRELDIQTVAEWVETEEQHNCLAALGADLGQGFLYGKAGALPQTGDAQVFRSR